MKNTWKSVGWLGMSTLPLLLCFAMQLAIGGFSMSIFAFVKTYSDGIRISHEQFMEVYMENAMLGAGIGLFAYNFVAIFIFGLWFYLVCVRPNSHIQRTGKILTLPTVAWSVLIAITICASNTQMVAVAKYFIPEVVNNFYELMENFRLDAFAIIAAIILAPISEELIFRGVIQHYAMKVSKYFWVANVIQALMFAIVHMNWVQGTYAFIIGLVLGWLRHRYKTLWVPIIVHFVNNFSTMTWLGKLLEQVPDNLPAEFGVFALAAMATVGILITIGRGEDENPTPA